MYIYILIKVVSQNALWQLSFYVYISYSQCLYTQDAQRVDTHSPVHTLSASPARAGPLFTLGQ